MAKQKAVKEPIFAVVAKKKIEGKLIFKSVDRMTAKFELEDQGQEGNRNILFPASLFPADFDPTVDVVEGSYTVEFRVLRK